MKKALLVPCLILLLAASALAQTTKPDFSGTWTLDLQKSDFGPGPTPDSIVSVIDHKDPALNVKTTQKLSQGEFINERKITTDGKENANKLKTPMGEQDVKSTTTWNGRTLVTAYTMNVQGNALAFNDSWELSEDGKTLTMVRDVKTDQANFTQRLVFRKQ